MNNACGLRNLAIVGYFVLALALAGSALAATELERNMPLSRYNGTKNVTSTIVIKKSGVYDYKNVLHIWKGKDWPCSGEKENGPQILRIEASNVTVKNFAFVGDGKSYGSNGLGDVIHITTCSKGQGYDCPAGMKNITLDHIEGHGCEDLLSLGTPKTENVTIKNSIFWPNPNPVSKSKLIYINYGKNVKITGNDFHGRLGTVRGVRVMPNNSVTLANNRFYDLSMGAQITSEVTYPASIKPGPTTLTLSKNQFIGTPNEANCDCKKDLHGDGTFKCDHVGAPPSAVCH